MRWSLLAASDVNLTSLESQPHFIASSAGRVLNGKKMKPLTWKFAGKSSIYGWFTGRSSIYGFMDDSLENLPFMDDSLENPPFMDDFLLIFARKHHFWWRFSSDFAMLTVTRRSWRSVPSNLHPEACVGWCCWEMGDGSVPPQGDPCRVIRVIRVRMSSTQGWPKWKQRAGDFVMFFFRPFLKGRFHPNKVFRSETWPRQVKICQIKSWQICQRN